MKTKNIFISHRGEDDEHVSKFKELLLSHGYNVRNSSIDSSKPNAARNEDYIKSLLRDGINWAGAFVVLIGKTTHESKFVDYEIQHAHEKAKRIIGVYIHGATESDLPKALSDYGDALVGWAGKGIIDAIDGQDVWQNPDGTKRKDKWNIKREVC